MTLWQDLGDFFKRERIWGVLFLGLFAVYVSIYVWQARMVHKAPSEALQNLKEAETKLEDKLRSTGGFQQLLAEKPGLLAAFNVFTLLIFVGIVSGVVLDALWVFRPRWRESFPSAHGPPVARGWSVRTIFKIIVLFMAVALGLSFVLAFVKTVIFPEANPNLLILIHTTLADFLCIALVVYFVHRLGGRWQDLGFKGGAVGKEIGVGLVAYLAILPLFLLVLVLLMVGAHLFSYEPPPHALVEVFLEEEQRGPGLIVYSIILACVTGPFLEEVFFRGFCYPAFKKRWGRGRALVLSAAFFGLIHQNVFAFVPIFILGLVLGYLYEKSGSLIPSIALHIVHNSAFISYFFLVREVLRGVGAG